MNKKKSQNTCLAEDICKMYKEFIEINKKYQLFTVFSLHVTRCKGNILLSVISSGEEIQLIICQIGVGHPENCNNSYNNKQTCI